MQIGFGFDVHRMVEGRKLIIGGVEIPFKKGLLGHSDADVLSHAIADALLGAAALGDIGKHFPDTDMKYKDISSLKLLRLTIELLGEKGFNLINIDSTVVLEKPKIASYIQAMRENIANALGVKIEVISVKATTTEGLGFTGTGEGASAYAVALIQKTE